MMAQRIRDLLSKVPKATSPVLAQTTAWFRKKWMVADHVEDYLPRKKQGDIKKDEFAYRSPPPGSPTNPDVPLPSGVPLIEYDIAYYKKKETGQFYPKSLGASDIEDPPGAAHCPKPEWRLRPEIEERNIKLYMETGLPRLGAFPRPETINVWAHGSNQRDYELW